MGCYIIIAVLTQILHFSQKGSRKSQNNWCVTNHIQTVQSFHILPKLTLSDHRCYFKNPDQTLTSDYREICQRYVFL